MTTNVGSFGVINAEIKLRKKSIALGLVALVKIPVLIALSAEISCFWWLVSWYKNFCFFAHNPLQPMYIRYAAPIYLNSENNQIVLAIITPNPQMM